MVNTLVAGKPSVRAPLNLELARQASSSLKKAADDREPSRLLPPKGGPGNFYLLPNGSPRNLPSGRSKKARKAPDGRDGARCLNLEINIKVE